MGTSSHHCSYFCFVELGIRAQEMVPFSEDPHLFWLFERAEAETDSKSRIHILYRHL